jgi:hypothetical protein
MEDTSAHRPGPSKDTLILRWVLGIVLGLIVLGAAYFATLYFMSPAAIRNPSSTHFHFRIQVIQDGQAVNFAQDKFQTEFSKDICTAALTKEPFHFHDHEDQFAHVHWDHMTGGLLLKDYGWNLVGGLSGVLGYRFNGLQMPQAVPVHGRALPPLKSGDKYWVYVGTADSQRQASWSDFLHRDLRDFFGSANATDEVIGATESVDLARLNHVVGSAVIFAQPNQPTADQVKDRFAHLLPLPESQCAG